MGWGLSDAEKPLQDSHSGMAQEEQAQVDTIAPPSLLGLAEGNEVIKRRYDENRIY